MQQKSSYGILSLGMRPQKINFSLNCPKILKYLSGLFLTSEAENR